MTEVRFTIERIQPDRLRVHASTADHTAEATHPLPDGLADLLAEARGGGVAATRFLADILGGLLLGDAPGSLLRGVLATDPLAVAVLEAEPACALWPWELARDPVTQRHPVADGLGLVRQAGLGQLPGRLPPRGVLVVPAAAGAARLEALVAATRGLARKAGFEITPADHPAGPALRRDLALGALLVHCEGLGADGRLELDDGRVPIDRIGLDGSAWLAVIGGAEAAPEAALALRHAGVQAVIGRQVELDAHAAASTDRELYRALAAGASPVEAVRRARRSLVASHGVERFLWAAPLLWSAPALPGAGAPATLAFPPRVTLPPAEVEPPVRERPAPLLAAPVTDASPPVPAPIFVRDTVRLLRAGIDPLDPEVEARVAALRALGGGLEPDLVAPADLPAEQRTGWLADRLVDGVGRPDLPLLRPGDADARLRRAASRAATSETSARRLANALIASRAVALQGDGGRALATAIGTDFFGFHLEHVACGPGSNLIGAPCGDLPQQGDGWLFRSLALNWRRDELDPGHPSEPRPRTRMRLLGRQIEGWRVLLGTWLLISGVEFAAPGELQRLLAALEDGALTGFDARGAPFRIAVPADYRVILLGDEVPGLAPWVPVVRVQRAGPDVRMARWLTRLEQRSGPAGDAVEEAARLQLAEHIDAALAFAGALAPLPLDSLGEAMLAFAVECGAPGGLDEALSVFLAPRLPAGPPRHAMRAWLLGDRQALLAAARDGRLLPGIAAYLDQVDPTGVPRVETLAELGPAAWVTESGLDAPGLPAPAFLRQLAGG
ncbi:MAG: CHAT domain-containing protein [Myxococcales bacterium]|nr:CHAT domain-containing protein [Myxococcales bacterium]